MNTEEVVKLVKEWKDEIVKITSDYSRDIATLDVAIKNLSKKGWFERHKDWIVPILIPAALLTLAIIGFQLSGAESIKIGNVEIVRHPPMMAP